jgi:protein-tyrosine phosphatase
MDVFQVDDEARLFISPALENWDAVARYDIDTVIDLEGDLDTCIPTAALIAGGHRVLSHCGMGYNRSAFVAGLIMIELGMSGPDVVARLRERRPGALFNDGFADCLASLTSTAPLAT